MLQWYSTRVVHRQYAVYKLKIWCNPINLGPAAEVHFWKPLQVPPSPECAMLYTFEFCDQARALHLTV
jgi:hypothetical protein